MGITALEKVQLDLMHPGRPVLTCPRILQLQLVAAPGAGLCARSLGGWQASSQAQTLGRMCWKTMLGPPSFEIPHALANVADDDGPWGNRGL